jgi:hypothetical protein
MPPITTNIDISFKNEVLLENSYLVDFLAVNNNPKILRMSDMADNYTPDPNLVSKLHLAPKVFTYSAFP